MIWSVAINKGGTGKSTTAREIAYLFARRGGKTLLVDMDPNGHVAEFIGIDKRKCRGRSMAQVLTRKKELPEIIITTDLGYDIAPATSELVEAEIALRASSLRPYQILDQALQGLPYDHVVIDTPPNMGFLSLNAVVASDGVIVPLQLEFPALLALSETIAKIQDIQRELKPELERVCILPTMDTGTKMSREVLEYVRAAYGDKLYPHTIRRTIKFAESAASSQPLCLYAPQQPAARAYEEFSLYLLAVERRKVS